MSDDLASDLEDALLLRGKDGGREALRLAEQAVDRIRALEAHRGILVKTLELYAGGKGPWGVVWEPIDDKGAVARAALQKLSEEKTNE